MTPEQMDELVEAHIAAEDVGDLDAALAVYTDDIEHDVVGAPDGPLRGMDAARNRYEQLLKQIEPESMVRTRRYHAEDACVVEHLATCRVVGELGGIAGEGRRVSFRVLHVFEFRNGRISRENVWMDSATMMAQLTADATATSQRV